MSEPDANASVDGGPALSPCEPTPWFEGPEGRWAPHPSEALSGPPVPDTRAIVSVLQFGAVVPPLSPWSGVNRILPGNAGTGAGRGGPPNPGSGGDLAADATEGQQVSVIERRMDEVLKERLGSGRDPVVLFSGGVDSGFIASRLAAMGRRDSLLVNFSFGRDDEESELAEAMARELGLPFKRVTAERPLCACLEQPGRDYPLPFGDHSTVPTSELAWAVMSQVDLHDRPILDGTGADGAFGLQASLAAWARLARVPAPLRSAIAAGYRLGLHTRRGRLERLARILRRYTQLGPVGAVVGQNPLGGILYRDAHRPELVELLLQWLRPWAGDTVQRQTVAADLALTCANVFAQKAHSLYRRHDHRVVYPFLDDAIIGLALDSLERWDRYPAKRPLKQSLAGHVPADMVYRRKSGFVDPRGSVFRDAAFVEHLRASTEPDAPVAGVLNGRAVRKLCDHLVRGGSLPDQTLNCVWAIVFTDRWYRTAPSGPADPA